MPNSECSESRQVRIDEYVRACHAEIDGFVRDHYGWRGTLRLHRRVIGADLVKAPVKLFLAIPLLVLPILMARFPRLDDRLRTVISRIGSCLETSVDREVKQLVRTRVLNLDASDDRLERLMSGHGLREIAEGHLASYASSRAAMAEITTMLVYAGLGGIIVHQFTPTAISLGPSLANVQSRMVAIEGFPLGEALGSIWYTVFSVTVSPLTVIGMTAGLLVAMSVVAGFAGVIADPVQRMLGLHHRRLRRLVRATGHALENPGARGFDDPIRLLPRFIDLIDGAMLGLRKLFP